MAADEMARQARYGAKAEDTREPPKDLDAGGADAVDYDLFRTPATERLKATRDYAFSATRLPLEQVVLGAVEAVRRYGFCVIDDVIPESAVEAVREEVREAPSKNRANKELGEACVRRAGRLRWPSEPVSDLVWMPQYAKHLGNPAVVAVAKAMLDDHVRIAQFNFRAIGVTADEQLASPNRRLMREWHTDWPHDLIGYGASCPRLSCQRRPRTQPNSGLNYDTAAPRGLLLIIRGLHTFPLHLLQAAARRTLRPRRTPGASATRAASGSRSRTSAWR